jgi:hypothetical protein
MAGLPDWPYGPYTIDDLDALPDEGVRRELVNGWILVAPRLSTFHDHAAKIMERGIGRRGGRGFDRRVYQGPP